MISMIYSTLVNASGIVACTYGIIIIQNLHKMVNNDVIRSIGTVYPFIFNHPSILCFILLIDEKWTKRCHSIPLRQHIIEVQLNFHHNVRHLHYHCWLVCWYDKERIPYIWYPYILRNAWNYSSHLSNNIPLELGNKGMYIIKILLLKK